MHNLITKSKYFAIQTKKSSTLENVEGKLELDFPRKQAQKSFVQPKN